KLNGNNVGSGTTNTSGMATTTVYLTSNGTATGTLIAAGTYSAGLNSGVSAGFASANGFTGSNASSILTVQKANQSITFTSIAPNNAIYGGTYTVTATGGASGNP